MRPSIATEIALKPQAKKVILHLEKRGSISTMEALMTYSIQRLAAVIYDLREAGFEVLTDLRTDEAGKRYSRYILA